MWADNKCAICHAPRRVFGAMPRGSRAFRRRRPNGQWYAGHPKFWACQKCTKAANAIINDDSKAFFDLLRSMADLADERRAAEAQAHAAGR